MVVFKTIYLFSLLCTALWLQIERCGGPLKAKPDHTTQTAQIHTSWRALAKFMNLGSYAEDVSNVTSKKSPNVYKSCPKMIPLENWKILTPLQKLLTNMGDLGKIIITTGFEKLPKVQIIAQSGHTGCER